VGKYPLELWSCLPTLFRKESNQVNTLLISDLSTDISSVVTFKLQSCALNSGVPAHHLLYLGEMSVDDDVGVVGLRSSVQPTRANHNHDDSDNGLRGDSDNNPRNAYAHNPLLHHYF